MTHYSLNNESICGTAGELTTTPETITCPECQRLAPPSMNPYLLIKWSRFIPNYAPSVKNYRDKATGRIRFTEADRAAINAGMAKYIKALQNAVFCLLLLLASCSKSIDPPKPVETVDKVWVKDMSVFLETTAQPYGRIFYVSVDVPSAVATVKIDVPAGHRQAELAFWGDRPDNPKILRIERY